MQSHGLTGESSPHKLGLYITIPFSFSILTGAAGRKLTGSYTHNTSYSGKDWGRGEECRQHIGFVLLSD